jgi:hypothetical protein
VISVHRVFKVFRVKSDPLVRPDLKVIPDLPEQSVLRVLRETKVSRVFRVFKEK